VYARVTRIKGDPAIADQAADWFAESALPGLREQPGFAGAIDLLDRESGLGMTITLWETEEAGDTSEKIAAAMRDEGASELDAEIVGVERYEVTTSVFEGARV
jgi:heme-degrading monooxygenase HmoA